MKFRAQTETDRFTQLKEPC